MLKQSITKTNVLVLTQGAMPLVIPARADEILPGLANFDYDVT